MHQYIERVVLQCLRIQALSDNEILSLIPADTLAEIKAKDPHPFFQAYSICHEGTSTPTILGDTAKPIHWTRRAVQSIKNVVTKGVKFFWGHNADNSTAGRRELGEIVTSFDKEINGVLHHVAISYHRPDVKDEAKKYDICSQEAEWNFFDVAGHMVADTVENITGIALSSSDVDQPAFLGAKRLGMVQAFGVENTNKNKEGELMDLTTVSFKDLKEEMIRRNTFPSQLFTLDEIKNDRVFTPVFTEAEALKTQVQTKDDEIKQLKTSQEQLNKQSQQSTAKQRLISLVEKGDIKLTDKQKEFVKGITDKFDNFSKYLSDYSDDGLKNFINQKLSDDFPLLTALAGNGSQSGSQQQTQTAGGQGGTVDPNDATKKANNPLLSEDID